MRRRSSSGCAARRWIMGWRREFVDADGRATGERRRCGALGAGGIRGVVIQCTRTGCGHRGLKACKECLLFLSSVHAGIAQLVEHNLAKVGVAGSSPVSRSHEDRRPKTEDRGLHVPRRIVPACRRSSVFGHRSSVYISPAGMAKLARREGLKIPWGQPHPSSSLGPGIALRIDTVPRAVPVLAILRGPTYILAAVV